MIRRKLRILSAVVAASFLVQDLSFAALQMKPSELALFPKSIPSIELPRSVATVGESYQAHGRISGKDKTFILIQDAHTNESAQMNIARSLKSIIEKEKIRFLFLEAADGNNSLALVRDKAPEKKRQQVAREYLRKGILDGSEYLDITADPKLDFIPWGVENKELYWQSLKAYEKVAKGRERFHAYLNEVARAIETLKPRIFGASLQEFDQKRQQFLKEKMPLTDYIEVLMQQMKFRNIAVTHYPHLLALSKLKDKEKSIDFNKANEEQADAMNTLSAEDQEILQEAAMGGKDAPFKLSMQDHKTQKAFYALLEERLVTRSPGHKVTRHPEEAKPTKDLDSSPAFGELRMTVYPELSKYFEYLKEAEKISPKDILEEQKLLEEEIYTSLAKTDDERALHKADEAQRFLQKLFNLTVTPDEFRAYKKDKESYSVTNITGFLNRKIMDLRDFYERVTFLKDDYEDYVKSAEEFYRLTYERDMAFLDNSISMMDKVGDTKAILVTGGYHTPNLMNLLKDKSLSYIVVTPQVLHETNQKKYESLLLSQTEKDVDITPKKMKTADHRPQTTDRRPQTTANNTQAEADKIALFKSMGRQMVALAFFGATPESLQRHWNQVRENNFHVLSNKLTLSTPSGSPQLSQSATPAGVSTRIQPSIERLAWMFRRNNTNKAAQSATSDGARLAKSAVPIDAANRFRGGSARSVFDAPSVIQTGESWELKLDTQRYTTDEITAGALNQYLSERGITGVEFYSFPSNPSVIYALPSGSLQPTFQGTGPHWDLSDNEGIQFSLNSLAGYIKNLDPRHTSQAPSSSGRVIQADFGARLADTLGQHASVKTSILTTALTSVGEVVDFGVLSQSTEQRARALRYKKLAAMVVGNLPSSEWIKLGNYIPVVFGKVGEDGTPYWTTDGAIPSTMREIDRFIFGTWQMAQNPNQPSNLMDDLLTAGEQFRAVVKSLVVERSSQESKVAIIFERPTDLASRDYKIKLVGTRDMINAGDDLLIHRLGLASEDLITVSMITDSSSEDLEYRLVMPQDLFDELKAVYDELYAAMPDPRIPPVSSGGEVFEGQFGARLAVLSVEDAAVRLKRYADDHIQDTPTGSVQIADRDVSLRFFAQAPEAYAQLLLQEFLPGAANIVWREGADGPSIQDAANEIQTLDPIGASGARLANMPSSEIRAFMDGIVRSSNYQYLQFSSPAEGQLDVTTKPMSEKTPTQEITIKGVTKISHVSGTQGGVYVQHLTSPSFADAAYSYKEITHYGVREIAEVDLPKEAKEYFAIPAKTKASGARLATDPLQTNEYIVRRDGRIERRKNSPPRSSEYEINVETQETYKNFMRSNVRPGRLVAFTYKLPSGTIVPVESVIFRGATESGFMYSIYSETGDTGETYTVASEQMLTVTLLGARMSAPSDFDEFVAYRDEMTRRLQSGELGSNVLATNIKEMQPDMGSIYTDAAERTDSAYFEHVSSFVTRETPAERKHDLPGVFGIVKGMLKAKIDWLKQKVLLVIDGGFKTRLSVKTLAYGYNGLMKLPSGVMFREFQIPVLASVTSLLGEEKSQQVIPLGASDNFTVPADVNIAGRPLSEMPDDMAFAGSGAKTQLLTESQIATITAQANGQTAESDIRTAIASLIPKSEFDSVRRTILSERLNDLGMMAADPKTGELMWFGEKVKDNVELVYRAYQNGGSLYKNAYLPLLNKSVMSLLYQKLNATKAKTEGVGQLDELAISLFTSIFQTRFETDESWQEKAPKNIAVEDWMEFKKIVDQILADSKRKLYVYDFGKVFLWKDAGDLGQMRELMASVVSADAQLKSMSRKALGIPQDTNRVRVEERGNVTIDPGAFVIDSNISTEGSGRVIIEAGAVVTRSILRAKVGETLRITRNSQVIESDLSNVSLEVHDDAGIGFVIDRFFKGPEDAPVLKVYGDEHIVTIDIDGKLYHPRGIISLPFKGDSIEKILMSKDHLVQSYPGLLDVEGAEGRWDALVKLHPYLAQYRFEDIRAKEFIALRDTNLAGLNFDGAQKRVNYKTVTGLAENMALASVRSGDFMIWLVEIGEKNARFEVKNISEQNRVVDAALQAIVRVRGGGVVSIENVSGDLNRFNNEIPAGQTRIIEFNKPADDTAPKGARLANLDRVISALNANTSRSRQDVVGVLNRLRAEGLIRSDVLFAEKYQNPNDIGFIFLGSNKQIILDWRDSRSIAVALEHFDLLITGSRLTQSAIPANINERRRAVVSNGARLVGVQNVQDIDKVSQAVTGARLADTQYTSRQSPDTTSPVDRDMRAGLIPIDRTFRGVRGSRLVGLAEAPDAVTAELDVDGKLAAFVDAVAPTAPQGARFSLISRGVAQLFKFTAVAAGFALVFAAGPKVAIAFEAAPLSTATVAGASGLAISNEPSVSEIVAAAKTDLLMARAEGVPTAEIRTKVSVSVHAQLFQGDPNQALSFIAGARMAGIQTIAITEAGNDSQILEVMAQHGVMSDLGNKHGIVIRVTNAANYKNENRGKDAILAAVHSPEQNSFTLWAGFFARYMGVVASIGRAFDGDQIDVAAVRPSDLPNALVEGFSAHTRDRVKVTPAQLLAMFFKQGEPSLINRIASLLPQLGAVSGSRLTQAIRNMLSVAGAA